MLAGTRLRPGNAQALPAVYQPVLSAPHPATMQPTAIANARLAVPLI
jgi:hypothetical protein